MILEQLKPKTRRHWYSDMIFKMSFWCQAVLNNFCQIGLHEFLWPNVEVASPVLTHLISICFQIPRATPYTHLAEPVKCIQSGRGGALYDIIQGTEEWKGAETRFIQEVGTFWCIHFNIGAHTDTSHRWPVPHLDIITLMFDLTCLHQVNFANFFFFFFSQCVSLQKQRWPWHSGSEEMMRN